MLITFIFENVRCTVQRRPRREFKSVLIIFIGFAQSVVLMEITKVIEKINK